jgi:hypothetical protein
MGASSAGSYEVTPPGRSRASDAAHQAERSTQRQQPTRQAYGESDTTGDATPILTGLQAPCRWAPASVGRLGSLVRSRGEEMRPRLGQMSKNLVIRAFTRRSEPTCRLGGRA